MKIQYSPDPFGFPLTLTPIKASHFLPDLITGGNKGNSFSAPVVYPVNKLSKFVIDLIALGRKGVYDSPRGGHCGRPFLFLTVHNVILMNSYVRL